RRANPERPRWIRRDFEHCLASSEADLPALAVQSNLDVRLSVEMDQRAIRKSYTTLLPGSRRIAFRTEESAADPQSRERTDQDCGRDSYRQMPRFLSGCGRRNASDVKNVLLTAFHLLQQHLHILSPLGIHPVELAVHRDHRQELAHVTAGFLQPGDE